MSFFSDSNVIKLTEIDSTNDYLKRKPELWHQNYFTVYTSHQTKGRGRNSREWFSKPGDDLAFSFLFLSKDKMDHLPCISLCVGLAVLKSLSKILGAKVDLKWPNDIQYRNKKICGILCERIDSLTLNSENILIIGVGININSESFPPPIQEKATSIRLVTKRRSNIKEILFKTLNLIKKVLDDFTVPMKEGIRYEILAHTNSIGSAIRYRDQNGLENVGIIVDMNPFGELLVKSRNGNIYTINNHHDDLVIE